MAGDSLIMKTDVTETVCFISKNHERIQDVLQAHASARLIDGEWYQVPMCVLQAVLGVFRGKADCVIPVESQPYCLVSKMYERIDDILSKDETVGGSGLVAGIYYRVPNDIMNGMDG